MVRFMIVLFNWISAANHKAVCSCRQNEQIVMINEMRCYSITWMTCFTWLDWYDVMTSLCVGVLVLWMCIRGMTYVQFSRLMFVAYLLMFCEMLTANKRWPILARAGGLLHETDAINSEKCFLAYEKVVRSFRRLLHYDKKRHTFSYSSVHVQQYQSTFTSFDQCLLGYRSYIPAKRQHLISTSLNTFLLHQASSRVSLNLINSLMTNIYVFKRIPPFSCL